MTTHISYTRISNNVQANNCVIGTNSYIYNAVHNACVAIVTLTCVMPGCILVTIINTGAAAVAVVHFVTSIHMYTQVTQNHPFKAVSTNNK